MIKTIMRVFVGILLGLLVGYVLMYITGCSNIIAPPYSDAEIQRLEDTNGERPAVVFTF